MNHFGIQIDTDSNNKIIMNNNPIIYVKTKKQEICPVIIITNIENNNTSEYEIKRDLLLNYYKSLFIDAFDDDNIDKLMNYDKSVLENLKEYLENLKEYLKEYLKKQNFYVVYHPFYNMKDTSTIGDTYKKMFTEVGDNELGIQIMNSIYDNKNIPEISEDERLLLKKNIDKMFDVSEISDKSKYKKVIGFNFDN